jgi:uncharacterized protein DUF397
VSDKVWKKASASNANDNCVEMARDGELVLVRDSKNPHGPVLAYTKKEISAWLDGAKRGEFDEMAD